MRADVVIGLDVGTTGCKAVLMDDTGRALASARATYALHAPQPGWAEQDVTEVWEACARVLSEVGRAAESLNVRAIGLSGAMHTLLPVDGSMRPLARASTWADSRATDLARELAQAVDLAALYEATGCPWHPAYHLARLRWYRAHMPELPSDVRFVAIKDWVLHRLTGVLATDVSLAATTGLLDLQARTWHAPALEIAGVTAATLPTVVPCADVVGKLRAPAAQETGLSAEILVVSGGSDGAMANVGACGVNGAGTVVTVGTSGAIRRIVENPHLDPQRRSWCYALGTQRWLAGGAINNGGLTLAWIRERFYAEISEEEAAYRCIEEEASAVEPGCGGLILLPYFTGERAPLYRADLRAGMFGLSLGTTRGMLARTAMEGVAQCLGQVWEALGGAQLVADLDAPIRITGGITRSPLWMQIVADALGTPMLPIESADASALGAAVMAWVGIGMWRDLPALTPPRADDESNVIKPDEARHQLYADQSQRFAAHQAVVLQSP